MQKTRSSGPSGWAWAINDLAKRRKKDPEQLFFKYVQQFIDEWAPEVEESDQ